MMSSAGKLTGCCSQRLTLTLAAAAVGWVSVVSRDAALALSAGGQVLALLTDALVDALTVAITLTRCQPRNKAVHLSAGHSVKAGKRM